ncbi:MAG TPA: Hsp70 family protein [Sulfurospirillum arcachonense]|nr:Hsp70 family protein [Sulfurospirillum arcachonense]
MKMNKVYGIDLGTTYSCIAHVDEHGKPAVINNSDNELTTPSVVYFESDDNIVVGKEAKEVAEIYPNQVASTIKRVMGDPEWKFTFNEKEYSSQEISSFILEKVVKDAIENIGEDIKNVVITVPAYFGVNQKEATKQAGELAGLNVIAVIPEPTAAAISYGIESNDDEVVMVYDLGGGTFDISVIEVKDKGINVIATDGDHQLGGRNWDERLASYFAQEFEDQTGVSSDDLQNDMETWQELLNKAENAKKSLTSKENTKIRIAHEGDKATIELSRDKFNELTNDLIERTISLTDAVLEQVKLKGYNTIDKILLVGGSTYMLQVRNSLEAKYSFDIEVHDPNLSVAKGAAIYGWKLELQEEIKFKIAEESGEEIDDIDLNNIEEEELVKAQQEVIQEKGLVGLAGAQKIIETTIRNVTAKSFGIAVMDQDKNEKIVNLITVDDEIPSVTTQIFPTAFEGQSGVNLVCYENTERVENNYLLGLETSTEVGSAILEFEYPLPIGSEIEITFSLSEDGLLKVYGKDLTTNRDIESVFQTESILSQEELSQAKEQRKSITVS